MPKFELASGAEFVAVQLIYEFSVLLKSPIFDPEVTRVGVSVKKNRFSVNLIESLYVKFPLPPPLTPE